MNFVQEIRRWKYARQKSVFFLLRVILGLTLILKGIIFQKNFNRLDLLLHHSAFHFGLSFWVYYIGFAHLLGGIFIIIGLLTRLAVLAQVPVVAGAVFFINPYEGGCLLNNGFLFSLVVLLVFFYFLAKGAGGFSMDA
jgi:putative oxidoreductase